MMERFEFVCDQGSRGCFVSGCQPVESGVDGFLQGSEVPVRQRRLLDEYSDLFDKFQVRRVGLQVDQINLLPSYGEFHELCAHGVEATIGVGRAEPCLFGERGCENYERDNYPITRTG
jgi:hypothetical protein